MLEDGTRAAGAHVVRLDAVALPPGVYVVYLAVDGARATQRVAVVR